MLSLLNEITFHFINKDVTKTAENPPNQQVNNELIYKIKQLIVIFEKIEMNSTFSPLRIPIKLAIINE
ncbi:hypothetical protein J41TS2_16040 [Bacillus sonorensis]|nr:hypothetical protein J41TS2_16040 [Bacillus sonorensis]